MRRPVSRHLAQAGNLDVWKLAYSESYVQVGAYPKLNTRPVKALWLSVGK